MLEEFLTNDAKRRKIISRVAIVLVIIGIFYLTISGGITLTEEMPEMFTEYSDKYIAKGKKMIYLTDDNIPVYPITHDNKSLYILNGAEDDFKKYYIDRENNEIVIEKNRIKYFAKGEAHYQLIKINSKKYEPIVNDGKIKIRIIYLYQDNQTTLLEYDLQTKTTQEISSTYVPQ